MQDKSIVQIGRAKGSFSANAYENFVENMFPGEAAYQMLIADFNLEDSSEGINCRYAGADLDKASSKTYLQYAYRKGSSRGGDITITTKSGDFDKKFSTVLKQAAELPKICRERKIENELPIFTAFDECLKSEQEKIKTDISVLHGTLPKEQQQKSGFTVRFSQNGEAKYLLNFVTIQTLLIQSGTEGKSNKYDVFSEGKDKFCSICMEQKPIVHGFASPFKYATVDKPGFVSGFFRQENNWKNYPICSDCALDFEMGRNYIKSNLTREFYKRYYYIIPKPVLDTSEKSLKQILKTLEGLEYKENEKTLTTREDYIMHQIGKEFGESNSFSLNLLFFQEDAKTAAIKIKLLLEEIVPSRFREIFITVPNAVNSHPLYQNAYEKKDEAPVDLRFSFGLFRDFFEDDFYLMTQTVFLGQPLDREILYSSFIERYVNQLRIKQRGGKEYDSGDITIKKAHLLLAYLETLKIIKSEKNNRIMDVLNQNAPPSEETQKEFQRTFDIGKYLSFVAENQGFLNTEIKEGIFAIGVLTKLLFNLQSANLDGGTPFEKKLKGYRLNPETLKNIYIEVLDKISQYTSSYAYADFREVLTQKFVRNAHLLGKISNNELSFYFVAGLEIGNQFKTQKDK